MFLPLPGPGGTPYLPASGVLSSGLPQFSSGRPARLALCPSPLSFSSAVYRSRLRSAMLGWCPHRWYHHDLDLEVEDRQIYCQWFGELIAKWSMKSDAVTAQCCEIQWEAFKFCTEVSVINRTNSADVKAVTVAITTASNSTLHKHKIQSFLYKCNNSNSCYRILYL